MNKIKRYDEYIYVDHLNESYFVDLKDKLLKRLNSFKHKDNLFDLIYKYLEYGKLFYIIFTIIYISSKFLPSGGIPSSVFWICWAFYMLSLIFNGKIINIKKRFVDKKFEELSEQNFDINSIYLVSGSIKNVKKAINKLKEDGILNDGDILELDDVTLVDFNQKFKKIEKVIINKDIDPLGEENWDDGGQNFEHDLIYKDYREVLIYNAEIIYNVKLLSITNKNYEIDRNYRSLSFMKIFSKKSNIRIYNYYKNDFLQRYGNNQNI